MTSDDKGTQDDGLNVAGASSIQLKLPVPLSTKTIISAIDAACGSSRLAPKTSSSSSNASLSQIRWNSHHFASLPHQDGEQTNHPSLLYNIVGELEPNSEVDQDHDRRTVTVVQASFYFAYSTWDGRILYVDQIRIVNDTMDDQPAQQRLIFTVYRILANIAVTLHCRRLTWQHTKDHTIVFPTIGTLQPQTLHGWLTLHWEKEAIIQFLSGPRESASSETTISTIEAVKYQSSSFQHSIVTTLHRCNTSAAAAATIATAGSSLRRLRLANSNDMDTVGRLVQGLADFEKEPDAVNVTPDHYRIDGFQSDPPLFYCLLLEVTTSKPTTISTEQDINTNDDTHDWYACGMAFCWIGARQDQLQDHHHRTRSNTSILPQQEALFLYLEDLFIEEAYRGNGAGTFVMTTLGEIALSLNCNKMVWQALDWNTPALTFYQNKIGAHIVDGLLTTRFAGRALHEFHAL